MTDSETTRAELISISIVSHGHAQLVASLLDDLRRWRPAGIEVLLTLNIEEALPFHPGHFPFSVRSILNVSPQGFAANHNAAFELARGDFFCILNPDIRLTGDPFPELMDELKNPSVGAVAPLILGPNRAIEDSARPFPTPLSLFCKALGTAPKRYYEVSDKSISPDWIAGMFMLLRRDTFMAVDGFDARYHLYYEDVDLCTRLRLKDYDVRLVPRVSVMHFARRQSRGDARYFFWHLRSMTRYLLSGTRRQLGKQSKR